MKKSLLLVGMCFLLLPLFGQINNSAPYKVLTGHKHKISYLRYSNDGKFLASGSWDNTVRIWNMEADSLLYELKGHTDWVRQMSFSPDNKHIASCSQDGSFMVWDLITGVLIKKVEISAGKITKKGLIPELDRETINSLASIAYSPNGEFIATGSIDNKFRIWNANTYELLHILEGHNHSVFNIVFYNDMMITGAIYSELIVWDAKLFKPIITIREEKGFNGSFQLLQNGKYLANTGKCLINVWDISNGKMVRSLPVQCMLQSLEFTPDEKQMITCAEDHTVKIWDFETGKELWSYQNPKPEIADCKISPDGEYLAVATPESDILIWRMSDLLRKQ